MKAVDGRVVRPTLRCLIDDLGSEVGPAILRSALSTARREMAAKSRFLFAVPLAKAEHPLLDKSNLIALDANADRELIVSILDRSVIKVKTSDRRGALWLDASGTWWLLAAGRRKDDGPGDFYRDIAKFGRDSDPIAPTGADLTYLRLETAFIAECALDRNAHTAIVEALLAAAADAGRPQSVEIFGAHVLVQVDAEPDDETLSISFDFVSFEQRRRFPADVLGFVPGFESLDDWDLVPALSPGDPETWFTFVHRSWIGYLATSVELGRLLEGRTALALPATTTTTARRPAHRASASLVTLSYVEGIEITALCGVQFVAHRDPALYEECPTCTAALDLLRRAAGTDS